MVQPGTINIEIGTINKEIGTINNRDRKTGTIYIEIRNYFSEQTNVKEVKPGFSFSAKLIFCIWDTCRSMDAYTTLHICVRISFLHYQLE